MKIKKTFFTASPIKIILLSFIILIILGTMLLKLPWATTHPISIIDALFTATSSVCVTGLIVLDTAKDFTFFGQCVIIILIQFGGLGIMTFSVGLLTLFSGNLSIKWQFTFRDFYSNRRSMPIKSVLKYIVFYTIIIEIITALLLYSQFHTQFSFKRAAWYSLFHAISAFCNAGFSTFSNSIMNYNNNYFIMIVLSVAIILGGIGFLVLTEFTTSFKNFYRPKTSLFSFSLHTKIVLRATTILIILGTMTFLLLEWDNSLQKMNISTKLLTSFFQSITCRTAGFNSVDIGSLKVNTLFAMIMLMFIGGSPGSIAGGIKTTTMWVIISLIITKFKGKDQVVLWGRALNRETIDRSSTLLILAITCIALATFSILIFDTVMANTPFIANVFEMTSAFATVGLSTGVTPTMTISGKIITCIVMFVGRLGPLTLVAALTERKKNVNIRFPEEHIMIG